MAKIFQDLSYKVCSTISPNFLAFGRIIIVLGISARHYTSTTCYSAMRTAEILSAAPDLNPQYSMDELTLNTVLNYCLIFGRKINLTSRVLSTGGGGGGGAGRKLPPQKFY